MIQYDHHTHHPVNQGTFQASELAPKYLRETGPSSKKSKDLNTADIRLPSPSSILFVSQIFFSFTFWPAHLDHPFRQLLHGQLLQPVGAPGARSPRLARRAARLWASHAAIWYRWSDPKAQQIGGRRPGLERSNGRDQAETSMSGIATTSSGAIGREPNGAKLALLY